jgi:hypothetical protein
MNSAELLCASKNSVVNVVPALITPSEQSGSLL